MWNSEQKDVKVATVGVSVSIKGEIKATEDVTVDGQVEGRIDLPEHTLTIGPNATVLADINAKTVIVFGSVIGNVTARENADIRKTASVEGSLTCGRLSVQEGATIVAKFETKNRPAAADRKAAEKAAQLFPHPVSSAPRWTGRSRDANC
jgi:cytoskeletal protein CcmA (bactofilin family)